MKMKAKDLYTKFEKEYITCPITGSNEWHTLYDNDRYGMGVQTQICRDSGFIATNPRPTEGALNDFYQNHYRDYYFAFPDPQSADYLESENFKVVNRRADWLLDFVTPYLESNSCDVMDIGCADGIFLEKFHNRYPDASISGIEPDPRYGGYSAKRLPGEITIGDFNSSIVGKPEWVGRFDLVVLSHVLEHLAFPDQKIAGIRKIIKRGGLFLIEVPNILSHYWRGNGMFHIGHINQFYPDTLVCLLEKLGFEIERVFDGKHPADPWAMTVLCRKVEEPVRSGYRLPQGRDLDYISTYIAENASPRDNEETKCSRDLVKGIKTRYLLRELRRRLKFWISGK